jgi:hypothetical protein
MATLVQGQVLRGDGSRSTEIYVDASVFNMSALGVVRINPYSEVRGLRFVFDQPDSPTRADYHQYPPGIYGQSASQSKIDNVKMWGAWVGIDMRRNAGGSWLTNIGIGALETDVLLDGALDTFRIIGFHFWPYGYTVGTHRLTVYQNGPRTGISCGRVDGLVLSSGLIYGTPTAGLHCFSGTYDPDPTRHGPPVVLASNVQFDRGGLRIDACNAFVGSALTFVTGLADDYWMKIISGNVALSGIRVKATVAHTDGGIQLGDPVSPAVLNLSMSDVVFDTTVLDFTQLKIGSRTRLNVSGLSFAVTPNVARTNPLVRVAGASSVRGIIKDIVATDKGTGGGVIVQVDNDVSVDISGIVAPGWGVVLPAAQTNMAVSDALGISAANSTLNGALIGPVKRLFFTGNLVAGGATIPHGISALATRLGVKVAAYRQTGGNIYAPIDHTFSSTNIVLSGGVSTEDYRVTLEWNGA